MNYKRPLLTIALVLGLTGSAIQAATPTTSGTSSRGSFLDYFTSEKPIGATLSQGATYTIPTKMRSGAPGKMDVFQLETVVSYRKRWETNRLNLSLSYLHSDYDWSKGSPKYFDRINQLSLSGIYQHRFEGSNWGAYLIATTSMGSESGTSLTANTSYLTSAGASYAFSDNLTLSVGGLFISKPQESDRFFPIAFVEWTIDKHFSLRTFNGATLIYDVYADRELVLDFTAQYNSPSFRINRQYVSSVGALARPSVEAKSISASVGATYHIGGPFSLRGYVQGDFWREYKFRANNDKYMTLKGKPAMSFGLEVSARF